VFASLAQLVQLAGRNVVTQTVNLVVGGPDVALWSDGDTGRVAHAFGVDHAACAVKAVVANHAADADFVIQSNFVFGLDVVRLAQCHVDFAVVGNFTNATSVVERLLFHGDQLAFGNDLADSNVRTFVEVFSGREVQNAVGFSNNQETVFGKANTVGVAELDRRCESFDFSGSVTVVAVGHSPNGCLACTDEQHIG